MSQVADRMQKPSGTSNASRRATYGIDAPGAVLAFIVIGSLLALLAATRVGWPWSIPIPAIVSIAALPVALLFLGWSVVMLWSSLAGKMRVRDLLVDALQLSGNERVLDAGCGRGLALIACARKLTTGKAVGIDLWSAKDQSGNSPDATRANALAEGVADRVDVKTGDITSLPFPDASFDAIISMTVIHNISTRAGRDKALSELMRVLKPGGRIAIYDLLHAPYYEDVLREGGLTVRRLGTHFLWGFPGHSLLAQKSLGSE